MFRKSRSTGVLFDIAPIAFNGKRSVDVVKKQLIQFVKTFEEEDLFYLYNPGDFSVLNNLGDRVGVIGNYDTDGYSLQELSIAFKQTYYIITSQDEDSIRTVCYITNRFSVKEVNSLKKLFNIGKTLSCLDEPCDILIVAIGDHCNKELLVEITPEEVDLIFLPDPNNLNQRLQTYFEEKESEGLWQ